MSWRLRAASMLGDMLNKGKNEADKESRNYGSLFKKVINYPLNLIATFIFSPLILIKIILFKETSLIRKIFSIIALILAFVLANYLIWAATVLLAGAIFSNLGIFSTISFFFGFFTTTWVSIMINILIFNSITTLMLKINQNEVFKYLNELSNGNG